MNENDEIYRPWVTELDSSLTYIRHLGRHCCLVESPEAGIVTLKFDPAFETRALQELDDLTFVPSLVKRYEYDASAQRGHRDRAILREHFEGDDLSKYQGDISAMFDQAYERLTLIHERGIATRDMKKENLLYSDAMGITFIDLGDACFRADNEEVFENYRDSDVSELRRMFGLRAYE